MTTGIYDKYELIEDITFELHCMMFYKSLEKRYKHSRIGFMMTDIRRTCEAHMKRLCAIYKKEFGQAVDIKILREYVKA